jgi:hypothetical protein
MNLTIVRATASTILLLLLSVTTSGSDPGSTQGYWTVKQANAVLEKTLRVHLAPDLSYLTVGEREAVKYLLEVGSIMHRLYVESRHVEALAAREKLGQLTDDGIEPERARLLEELYRLNRGPIATTLSNERVPFLPVAAEQPGKNVYPWGISREEVDGVLTAYPGSASSLMHLRHVVRRSTPDNLRRDLDELKKYPVLDELHPGLKEELSGLLQNNSAPSLYALPYSVAYSDELIRAHRLLHRAADAVLPDDSAFARFLRNRARDLLTDDYESGDAAWVTGDFVGNLNAQIGSYETYDDALYGIKSFFSLCIFARDKARSDQLAEALVDIQDLENSLPYASKRKMPDRIPVGVYDVVADFGQSRGANTATILPNEGYLTTQYGRTILVRGNIISNDQIFSIAKNAFEAATSDTHHGDLTQEGNLYRTFWHEVGHYLGPAMTEDAREITVALGRTSNVLDEMKSDLISLFAVEYLRERGFYDERQARSVYASGIRRVLLKNEPRRDQDYPTMQLIQFNWFLEHKLLSFDTERQELEIDYSKYRPAVEGLLAKVLQLQVAGDEAMAEAFIESSTHWDESVNGVIAAKLRAAEESRFVMVTYDAVDGSDS